MPWKERGIKGRHRPRAALPRQTSTSCSSLDPTTWEFKLRPGIRFHDGALRRDLTLQPRADQYTLAMTGRREVGR